MSSYKTIFLLNFGLILIGATAFPSSAISKGENCHRIEDFIPRQSDGSQKSLVAVGESHLETNRTDVYSRLLRKLFVSQPKSFCLILEAQPYVDTDGKIEVRVDSLINYARTHQTGWQCDSKNPDCDRLTANYLILSRWEFLSVPKENWPVKDALSLSIPIYFVDKPDALLQTKSGNRTEWLNERDEFMAEKISKIFDSGMCTSALLINGSAHYFSSDPNRKTLTQRLQSIPNAEFFNFSDLENLSECP